jgi:hypothetical protein
MRNICPSGTIELKIYSTRYVGIKAIIDASNETETMTNKKEYLRLKIRLKRAIKDVCD